jgi:Extracellular link domain
MDINTTSTTNPVDMYGYVNNLVLNPIIFIILFLIIVAYFALFASLGNNGQITEGASKTQNIFAIIIIVILAFLIIVNAFQYFFSVNVMAYIHGLFSKKPQIDIVVSQNYTPSPVPEIKFKKQVFNIPGNYYNYENAKALCTAYGAQLANYEQIEDAYKGGAEWCNYGWSADQMALFPTQQKTWNNLQSIQGHENDCGRPGINGGYIANPNVQFGVNCYGYKPKITPEEKDLMQNSTPYPEIAQDKVFQSRVNFWKENLDDILVSPFNSKTWGQL